MAELLPSDTPAKCLDCGYSLRGLQDPRCPECGREFDPEEPGTMFWPKRLGRLRQFCSRPIGWRVNGVALAIALYTVIGKSAPGDYVGTLRNAWCAWLIFGVVLGGRFLVWLILRLAKRSDRRRGGYRWLVSPAVFGCMILLLWIRAPLYVAFWLSRPAMDRLAAEATQAPRTVVHDRWVGVYYAQEVLAFPGGVRFVVRGAGDGFTKEGFASWPGGPPEYCLHGYYKSFCGDWCFYSEDDPRQLRSISYIS